MHNLICFPHYTCGGLLCDILSNTFSPVAENGGINSINHSFGKIGDSPTVFDDYNPDDLIDSLNEIPAGAWIGTHCWPGRLPPEKFDRIIVVTTTAYKSKLYRWQRAYHNYFAPKWTELTGMEQVDKLRETAKNYLIPFNPVVADNIENIEFADIVENTVEFQSILAGIDAEHHLNRWQELNHFLYRPTVWTDSVADALYQAEVETHLNRFYRYQ